MATPTKFRSVGVSIVEYINHDECMVIPMVTPAVDLADKTRWINVSFLRTPQRAKQWSDVWFDDRGIDANGEPVPTEINPTDLSGPGITSIGPLKDLPRGQYFGGVYFRHEQFIKAYPKIKDPRIDPTADEVPWRPDGWFNYELTSVAYEGDADGKRRYIGCEAEIVDVKALKAKIKIYKPTDRANPVAILDLQLDDPAHCDLSIPADPVDLIKGGPLEPMLRTTSVAGDRGGIYLNLRFAPVTIGPKLPIWMEL